MKTIEEKIKDDELHRMPNENDKMIDKYFAEMHKIVMEIQEQVTKQIDNYGNN